MKSSILSKFGLIFIATALTIGLLSGAAITVNSPGGFNAGLTRTVGTSDGAGGLLRLGSSTTCDSLDPAGTLENYSNLAFSFAYKLVE